jgi:uncharacterized Rmd1/YagE family protein
MNDAQPQPASAPRAPDAPPPGTRIAARALLVGDRIDTTGLERSDVLSTAPLAFRAGATSAGFAAVFRFGVVALIGLTPLEEDEVLRALRPRTVGEFARHEEEHAVIELSTDRDDQIPPGGPVYVKTLAPERLIVIADALAKSAALAHNEHEVAAVFDVIEPFARKLADKGRTPAGRRQILQHIGNALLVQHRVSGRVAVEEKPDVLWDRPDLGRLYARLEDEYELKERADAINRKLAVVAETAKLLTDLIDTQRSIRLELVIVLLIVSEILLTLYQLWAGRPH